MSALTFKAVIGAVHVDRKKRTIKIQLEATSYVSLDELTRLGPQDESVRITLESEQARITPVGAPITIDEEAAKKLVGYAATGVDTGEEPADEEEWLGPSEPQEPEAADIDE